MSTAPRPSLSSALGNAASNVLRTIVYAPLQAITGQRSIQQWLSTEIEMAHTELLVSVLHAYERRDNTLTMAVIDDYLNIYDVLVAKRYQKLTDADVVRTHDWSDGEIKRYLGWTNEEVRQFREEEELREVSDVFTIPWRSGAEELPDAASMERPTGDEWTDAEVEDVEEPSATAADEADATPDRADEDDRTAPLTVFPWVVSAMEFLYDAHRMKESKPSGALRAFYAMKRQLLRGEAAVDPTSIARNAKATYHEMESLSGTWRTDAMRDYLCEDDELKDSVVLEDLIRANELLHDHYLEQYQWVENLRVNVLTFLAITAVAIGGIVVFFPGVFAVPFDTELSSLHLYVLLLSFGAIGASISGVRAIETEPESLQSMTQLLGYWLPLARIVIGSVSAFLVMVFLLSGFVGPEFLSLPLVLGIAFASGFSERFLLQAIQSFEGVTFRKSPIE